MKNKEIDFSFTPEDGRLARRNVRLAIVFALVAGLLLVGVFIVVRHLDFSKPSDETTAQTAEDPSDAETRAVRFLTVVSDENEVCLVALVNADPAAGLLQVKPLPRDLPVVIGQREGTLSSLFGDVGVTGLKTAIEEKYDMTVDRWIGVTAANVRNLFTLLGPTEVFFDRDVSFSVDAIKYSYRRGPAQLTGEALLAAVKNAYEGDENLKFGGKALASVLEAHLTVENVEKGEDFFSQVVNHLDSNVTAFDFAAYREALIAFLSASPQFTVVS